MFATCKLTRVLTKLQRIMLYSRLCYYSSYRLHRRELVAIQDPLERNRRLVELNVIEQCTNLFQTDFIQRQHALTKDGSSPSLGNVVPRIHACVFDSSTGELKRLDVDFGDSDSLDLRDDLIEIALENDDSSTDQFAVTSSKVKEEEVVAENLQMEEASEAVMADATVMPETVTSTIDEPDVTSDSIDDSENLSKDLLSSKPGASESDNKVNPFFAVQKKADTDDLPPQGPRPTTSTGNAEKNVKQTSKSAPKAGTSPFAMSDDESGSWWGKTFVVNTERVQTYIKSRLSDQQEGAKSSVPLEDEDTIAGETADLEMNDNESLEAADIGLPAEDSDDFLFAPDTGISSTDIPFEDFQQRSENLPPSRWARSSGSVSNRGASPFVASDDESSSWWGKTFVVNKEQVQTYVKNRSSDGQRKARPDTISSANELISDTSTDGAASKEMDDFVSEADLARSYSEESEELVSEENASLYADESPDLQGQSTDSDSSGIVEFEMPHEARSTSDRPSSSAAAKSARNAFVSTGDESSSWWGKTYVVNEDQVQTYVKRRKPGVKRRDSAGSNMEQADLPLDTASPTPDSVASLSDDRLSSSGSSSADNILFDGTETPTGEDTSIDQRGDDREFDEGIIRDDGFVEADIIETMFEVPDDAPGPWDPEARGIRGSNPISPGPSEGRKARASPFTNDEASSWWGKTYVVNPEQVQTYVKRAYPDETRPLSSNSSSRQSQIGQRPFISNKPMGAAPAGSPADVPPDAWWDKGQVYNKDQVQTYLKQIDRMERPDIAGDAIVMDEPGFDSEAILSDEDMLPSDLPRDPTNLDPGMSGDRRGPTNVDPGMPGGLSGS